MPVVQPTIDNIYELDLVWSVDGVEQALIHGRIHMLFLMISMWIELSRNANECVMWRGDSLVLQGQVILDGLDRYGQADSITTVKNSFELLLNLRSCPYGWGAAAA